MGRLPVTISRRRTPKAKISVFSSTMPCMKYSGAKYLLTIYIDVLKVFTRRDVFVFYITAVDYT
jgi:hypothetical protein